MSGAQWSASTPSKYTESNTDSISVDPLHHIHTWGTGLRGIVADWTILHPMQAIERRRVERKLGPPADKSKARVDAVPTRQRAGETVRRAVQHGVLGFV
jgi:hypothetical protein